MWKHWPNAIFTRRCTTWVLLLAFVPAARTTSAATIDFESILPGTTYGDGDLFNVGLTVLSQDGIDMSVELFELDSSIGFDSATVGGRFVDFFPTTPLELNNVGVRFDFSNLSFDVTSVTVEYKEFGGLNNFAVNDDGMHIIRPLSALPEAVTPGVSVSVTPDERITLTADTDHPITSFQIGGQELSIDNVVALPEPATLLLFGFGAIALARRRRG